MSIKFTKMVYILNKAHGNLLSVPTSLLSCNNIKSSREKVYYTLSTSVLQSCPCFSGAWIYLLPVQILVDYSNERNMYIQTAIKRKPKSIPLHCLPASQPGQRASPACYTTTRKQKKRLERDATATKSVGKCFLSDTH